MEATATHNVLGFHALLRSVAAALLYTLCLQMITLENLQQQDRQPNQPLAFLYIRDIY